MICMLISRRADAAPNIIHILADDFGWVDLSADSTNYGNGSNYYQTPNLEELASRGMSFTSAYTCQNCVPTPAALSGGSRLRFSLGNMRLAPESTMWEISIAAAMTRC